MFELLVKLRTIEPCQEERVEQNFPRVAHRTRTDCRGGARALSSIRRIGALTLCPDFAARPPFGSQRRPLHVSIMAHPPAVATLAALIARSPIVVAPVQRLPAGFGEVDTVILAWIAAEGRRIGRGFPSM
jgi:hypothetical protein